MRKLIEPIYISASYAGPTPTTQPLTASFTTKSSNLQFLDAASYQINITTTDSAGSFYLQVSNDNQNFVDIGQAASVASSNDTAVCEIDGFRSSVWVRLRYNSTTAGTGSCQILFTAKSQGA